MKLELKHKTAYLPYGVQISSLHSPKDVRTMGIGDLHPQNIDGSLMHLLPLSDLTKEIEVNGVKFVPFDWLEANIDMGVYMVTSTACNVSMWQYEEYQKLLEWHFDIYGLIEAGLAIDKNTL